LGAGEGTAGPLPHQIWGLAEHCCKLSQGVRGKALAAVDFGGFGIWNPAECDLKQQLFSFRTSELKHLTFGIGTDVNVLILHVC